MDAEPVTWSAEPDRPVAVSKRARLILAFAIGVATAAFFIVSTALAAGRVPTDFEFWWRGTRLWAHGIDPYLVQLGSNVWPLTDPLWYPGPALLATWPLHELPLLAAGALFVGGATGMLAWLLSAQGLWRLWFFASPTIVLAAKLGQWSPLLTVAALVPGAGFLLACKPTLGLAAFAYRPTWRAATGVVAITVLSLVLVPGWPLEWLHNLRVVPGHPPPIATPVGCLMVLALLRWRQREARLLFAMACVPQLLFFYDQLILGLTARTANEAKALSACSIAAFGIWAIRLAPGDFYVSAAAPYVLCGCYLPALVVVLRRPNEGPVPDWAERMAQRAQSFAGRALRRHPRVQADV